VTPAANVSLYTRARPHPVGVSAGHVTRAPNVSLYTRARPHPGGVSAGHPPPTGDDIAEVQTCLCQFRDESAEGAEGRRGT
jgi:hypothetical protein